MNVHQSTMSSPWQILYQTGSVQYCPRICRPCTTTTAQDRYFRVFHLCRLTVTATTTAAGIPGLLSIFVQTDRNRLRQHKDRPRWTSFALTLQLILSILQLPYYILLHLWFYSVLYIHMVRFFYDKSSYCTT